MGINFVGVFPGDRPHAKEVWPAVIAAAAAIGSGYMQAKMNKDAIEGTNATNVALTREQMEFQERMSSTAHRREVQDLRAAGLNPILSATGGNGASSPAGSSATMVAPQYDFTSSAKAAADAYAQFQSLDANLKNTAADTAAKLETAKLASVQSESSAKDVESKGMANAAQAGFIGQQLKKGELENRKLGYDVNMSGASFRDRLRQIQNESLISSSKVKSAEQAAKYDYIQDKIFENMDLMPSSARRPDDNAFWNFIHNAKDATSAGARKMLRTR